ncbi:MAG: LCP family protein [Actinobacteria bacterium]|nr:LCP family protein [Actinomycetota bacterium]
MRTTLKRGIGRAISPNGDANGNGHAQLPLAAPMRRYRQPPPPPRSTAALFGRIFGWIVLVLVVVGAGLGGGLYLYGHESLNAIAAHSRAVRNAQTILSKVPAASQPAIALIAGYDHRSGDGTTFAGSNSDTLMLVRADPVNKTLSLLSLPRDLVVPIYCTGDTVFTHDRINAAWALCGQNGPEGTLDTMEHLTGLQINYFITLDFHGFKQIVNRLHGVFMNVDRRYYIPPNTGVSAIDLEPGYQLLDGGQALQYVRYRHTDSDLYRNARQQLFFEALKSRVRSELGLTEIPQLIGALKGNLEIARGGGGAPSLSEIQAYAGLAYHLGGNHTFRVAIDPTLLQPYGIQGAELIAPQSAIDQAVSTFLHPDVSLPTRAGDQALGIKPKTATKAQKPLKPAQITTLVLNAGNVAGRAANTTYLLTQDGYSTRTLPPTIPANAPAETIPTTIYWDPVQPSSQQAARQLAQLFGTNVKLQQFSPAIAPFAQQSGNPLTVVALGTSFSGSLQPPAPVQAPPARQPAAVSFDPQATDSYLQQVRAKAGFRLMVPTQIANGSHISAMDGIRLFHPIRNHNEVVLSFVTGAGNVYWQVEETTWQSAPILGGATGQVTLGGRRYSLYTTGGHIQMIVLHQGGASYWVINTLQNELSNETMIAIARGLQPLAK